MSYHQRSHQVASLVGVIRYDQTASQLLLKTWKHPQDVQIVTWSQAIWPAVVPLPLSNPCTSSKVQVRSTTPPRMPKVEHLLLKIFWPAFFIGFCSILDSLFGSVPISESRPLPRTVANDLIFLASLGPGVFGSCSPMYAGARHRGLATEKTPGRRRITGTRHNRHEAWLKVIKLTCICWRCLPDCIGSKLSHKGGPFVNGQGLSCAVCRLSSACYARYWTLNDSRSQEQPTEAKGETSCIECCQPKRDGLGQGTCSVLCNWSSP